MLHPSLPRALSWASLLFLAASASSLVLPAQDTKRAVTHEDYDAWPSIRESSISADGKWIAYVVNPAWGDGEMFVTEIDGDDAVILTGGDR